MLKTLDVTVVPTINLYLIPTAATGKVTTTPAALLKTKVVPLCAAVGAEVAAVKDT